MISIGVEHFLLLYAGLHLLVLAIFWGRAMWRDATRNWNTSQDALCRCSECGFIFLVDRIVNFHTRSANCPECGKTVRVRQRKAANRMTY